VHAALTLTPGRFTVRAGYHHDIPVGITEPDLSVLWRGVDVRLFDDLRAQAAGSLHGRVEIVYLEPQQDAVSRRRRIRVDEVGVVFLVPRVQLKK
jgi:hypothetical protein